MLAPCGRQLKTHCTPRGQQAVGVERFSQRKVEGGARGGGSADERAGGRPEREVTAAIPRTWGWRSRILMSSWGRVTGAAEDGRLGSFRVGPL